MPSNDDLLFAEHAVKAGYLTEEDVQESLGVQARMEEMGVRDSLRNVLVKRGVLREGDAAVVARAAGLRSGREPIPGYTLEARIGSGAMGSVYRAHQRGMKRNVAIKILRRDLTDDPRQVERLQREAALVGRLDHPNIVRGLDSGETDGLIWFVMELVDGRTLHQRLRQSGPIPVDEAIALTRKLADALRHAHEHGVVHRDIKPGNILLTKDDEPRLTDYGLAKGESDDALTQLDATLGTPQYISPEQARNPRDADIRSDIYSLGATLYAMLAGRPPFQAETLAATLTKVLYEHPVPIDEAAEGVPEEVVYVVQRMMAKDRRHRYADPAALLRDLDALVRGKLHVPAGFQGDIEQFVTTRRKRRVLLTAALGIVLVCAAVAGGFEWTAARAERQREVLARGDLDALLVRPGDPATWSGETVDAMITGLEGLRTEHPGTSAAETALAELSRWRRQENAIARVQRLSLLADADDSPEWPGLLGNLRAEQERLRGDVDATVAAGRLRELVEAVESRRDQAAHRAYEAAVAEVSPLSLAEAATRLRAAGGEIRRTLFGPGRASPAADRATGLAARFDAARERLLAHLAPYDRVAGASDLATADLQQLETRLFEQTLAAEGDAELMALLGGLPPEGTRDDAIGIERERRFGRLVAASRTRLVAARAEAERLAEGGDLAGAESVLTSFARVALTEERLAAEGLRRELTAQRTARAEATRRLVDEAARTYFERLGRREYGAATDAVAELRALLTGRTAESGDPERFAAAAERLVALIEERVWQAFARRLRTGPLDRGLMDATGIRYQDLQDVLVEGDRLTFRHRGGHGWSGSIRTIVTDDVLYYSGVSASDAEGAAIIAAITVLETRPEGDPREIEERLVAVEPLLGRAARDRRLAPVVDRIAAWRLELVVAAQAEVADAEARAREIHDESLRALIEGRYVDAYSALDSLLNLTRMQETRYVRSRRDEIRADRRRAEAGRATARFAERLPGARLLDRGEGRAELVIDFDDPDATRALTLSAGRTSVEARQRIVADHPGDGAAAEALRENRFLSWAPWDGDVAHHPRRYPVELRHPFESARPVEIAFMYRSESPFFLLVAVNGTAFGVLSCPDVREGGRGVRIWHADSLERPDEAFGPQFRSSYLAREPGALKREGDTTYFHFEPGRTYRVRIVKDERDASLFIDGRRVASEEVRQDGSGELAGRILVLSYTSGELDDLRVSGWLDDGWLRGRR